MALTPRLELRQSQTLVMTPQLQKAIKLLQYSNLELREFIEEELADNPLLKLNDEDLSTESGMAEEHGASAMSDNVDPEYSEAPEYTDGTASLDPHGQEHVPEDHVNVLDMAEYGDVWEQEDVPSTATNDIASFSERGSESRIGTDYDGRYLEQTLSQKTSLRDHLMNQIQMEIHSPKDKIIAVFLTDHLDECGRLPNDLEGLAEHLGCDLHKMHQVLNRLQQLEPPGIFARSLKECWSIQLREIDRLDPAMETLLENIDLLKVHDYQMLAELCCVDFDDIEDMVSELWSLTHNPLDAFDQIVAQTVTPDVTMRPGLEGSWIVELNTTELPKVLVNNTYYAQISGKMRNKNDKKYVTDKLQWANWLVKSLHQRATTILKVASEIVSQQESFFELGVEHLKPLALRDIAEEIEMHESTVSRVTTNKYIDTPRGIFELKYFFTTAISSSNGGDYYSSEAVRHKIKTLIGKERPSSILSDDKLVELLNNDGVDIARRTVAKYREALKIPSSVHRRRLRNRSTAFTLTY